MSMWVPLARHAAGYSWAEHSQCLAVLQSHNLARICLSSCMQGCSHCLDRIAVLTAKYACGILSVAQVTINMCCVNLVGAFKHDRRTGLTWNTALDLAVACKLWKSIRTSCSVDIILKHSSND